MDKAVIDELLKDEEKQGIRHDESEIRAAIGEGKEKAAAAVRRVEELKNAVMALQDELRASGWSLKDLYDDLDFSQTSIRGGSAEELNNLADEMERAAGELNGAADALGDFLVFRFN
ncbi:MAG: hypothetical protein IKI75_05920 [Lachnospiraceae bacterium]|nr:hypothetical protein [Lachnospiraceae bacterium]